MDEEQQREISWQRRYARGNGHRNGSAITGVDSEGPMTPEPDRVKESARAARARARAAVGKKHEAELRELDWLDQQVEQALSSPDTPALAAELGELERELNRVQLRWQHADVHMETTVASADEGTAEAQEELTVVVVAERAAVIGNAVTETETAEAPDIACMAATAMDVVLSR